MKHLRLLLASLAIAIGGGNLFAQEEGTYFFYNDASGLFLSRGSIWGTQCTSDVYGIAYELTKIQDGVYTLKNVDHSLVADANKFLGSDLYTDNGTACNFTFTAQGEGYLISKGNGYLTAATVGEAITENTEATDNSVWKLLTKDSYNTLLSQRKDGEAAAIANAAGYSTVTTLDGLKSLIGDTNSFVSKDYTSKVGNADIGGGSSSWTKGEGPKRGLGDTKAGDGVFQSWNGSTNIYQTVSNLDEGIYKLTVQAFYRFGNAAAANRVADKGSMVDYLYAGTNTSQLASWYDIKSGDTDPNSMSTAHTFLDSDANKALVEVFAYVGEDKSLKIGINNLGYVDQDWMICDNFKLTYYTDKISDEEIASLTATIPTNIPAALKESLNTLKGDLESSKTIAAYNALSSAIDEAKNVETVYSNYPVAKANVVALKSQTTFTDEEGAAATQLDADVAAADATVEAATTVEAINAAIKQVRTAAGTFAGAVKINKGEYLDLTDAMLFNAAMRETGGLSLWNIVSNTNSDYPKYNGRCSEFWQANFEFNQTAYNLPAGNYNIEVYAFHRAGNYNTYLYANNDNIQVLPIANGENSMTAAADAFDQGLYLNSLKITLDETQDVVIGFKNEDTETDKWTIFRDFKIKFFGDDALAVFRDEYESALAEAEAALAAEDYANVSGDEKAALSTVVTETYPKSVVEVDETQEKFEAATAGLKEATTNFKNAKAGWDNYANNYPAEKAKADAISTDIAAALAEPKNAAEAAEATNNLKVAEFNYVTENYTTAIELGEWTAEGGTTLNYGGQHWSGENRGYYEQTNTNYSTSAWKISFNQTIELPAGEYIFKVAGRHASGNVTMSLDVTSGETALGTVDDFPVGDTGKGIDTNGATNFSAEGTYANNNKGRGWEWRYVPFTLTEAASVKIAVNAEANAQYQWISFCDYTVQAKPNVEASKIALQQTIDAAEAVETPTANVGTGAFQFPEQPINTYKDAIEAAKQAKSDADATIESIESADNTLKQAIADYTAVKDNINAPSDGQIFNVILTYAGWTYDNKAMTYIANGRTDAGLYNIQYKETANVNLAQAFTFTQVEGNTYKMSQIDADGNVRYLSTGTPYGGNDSQIRTTTNADEAMVVTVIPTTTEGVYNLRNVAANNYIGSQDAGVFTVNSHIDFFIVEAQKPSITINTTAAGWGTTILPFAAEKPADVKVYSCAEMNGSDLVLTEVDALEANKPYVIEGAWNETLTGDAQGTQLAYTEGLLTGVYDKTVAAAGTYVMQKLNGKVSFYKVSEEKPITVPANRAYLTGASSEAKVLNLGYGDTDGINAIQALIDGDAEIFNANGVKQNSLQKGVNIIKMGNGEIRKIMVK